MFACLYIPPLAGSRAVTPDSGLRGSTSTPRPEPVEGRTPDSCDLASLAREFSPRVEVHGPGLVTLDARGLERLFGDAKRLGDELRRAAADRGMPARIAVAPTRTTAWLLVHARAGLTIVAPGEERRWLTPLPLRVLEQLEANGLGPAGEMGSGGTSRPASAHAPAAALLALLKRWGLTTLGEFGRLPPLDLSERLGQPGLAWQRLARGEEMAPLVPDGPEERFEETLDLEWPIEGLQPLSFVFGRLFDALSAHLLARDRAAAVLHVHLQLVTREVDRRSVQLPAPMRDARVLRTLALLNLEAHPVTAGIDRVTVIADPVPGRVIQHSLLTRALPMPEQMSTLLARLGAVMGDGRCGMAALVDSYRPGAFEMKRFAVEWHNVAHRRMAGSEIGGPPTLALRRFRIPVPAFVAVKDGRPVRVLANGASLSGGSVQGCAGPWRTSGEWWRVADARVQADAGCDHAQVSWNRDEWDVSLADGGVYRIYRDRDRDRWFVDGVID
jgi:protein ImuB